MTESLKQQLQNLTEENKFLRQALQFYAAKENWYPGDSFKQSCRIDENDLEYFSDTQTSDLIGGKLARAVLKNPTGKKIRRKRLG
ncbi:MAG: hypothetical protein ACXVAX_01120 [Pseudobdellovibrio sp.]